MQLAVTALTLLMARGAAATHLRARAPFAEVEAAAKGAREQRKRADDAASSARDIAKVPLEEAEALAAVGAKAAASAGKNEAEMDSLFEASERLLPSAQAASEGATEVVAAVTALSGVQRAAGSETESISKEAATTEGPKVEAELLSEAFAQAKSRGAVEAKKALAKQKKDAPIAAKKAMQPYNAAMANMMKTAAAFGKDADGLLAAAQNLQLQAVGKMQQANQWRTLGVLAKEQTALQEAHQAMALADSLTAKANGEYGTAQKLMGEAPRYVTIGAQAAYYAEIMINPDAPPPAQPLV